MKLFPSRRCGLNLAAVAVALQVLGGFLPSLVVCCRPDRPPQVEFFSVSCSCRLGDPHSCADQGCPGAPHLTGQCVDIHIDLQAVPAAALGKATPDLLRHRNAPAAALRLQRRDGHSPERAAAGSGPPAAWAAPPAAAPAADPRRRC